MIKLIVAGIYLSFFILWCVEAGNPFYYFFNPGPPGQGAYLLSKNIGFLAVAGILVQVFLGVCSALKVGGIKTMHKANAKIAVLLVIGHAFLFGLGVSIRSGEVAFGLLVPSFDDYFHAIVALGLISLCGLVLTFFLGRTASRTRKTVFLKLHFIGLPVAALSLFHAFSIGSETRNDSVLFFFVALLVFFIGFIYMKRRRFHVIEASS